MASSKPTLTGTSCVTKPGLKALTKGNRNKLRVEGLVIIESIDIDACFQAREPNEPRWDYYIGIQGRGELYVEVHEVSEAEYDKLLRKAPWLREKITSLGWPSTNGRPLFLAPTKGISPFGIFGDLAKRLAMHKMTIAMKGDRIADLLD